MKCDQDLCLNLWYDLNKLLWQDELNPRVRCAFGNVSKLRLSFPVYFCYFFLICELLPKLFLLLHLCLFVLSEGELLESGPLTILDQHCSAGNYQILSIFWSIYFSFLCYFVWLKLLSYWKCDHHDLLLWWVIGCILLASVAASVKCNKLEQMGKMIAWANITSNTLLEMALIIIMTT